jgi:excisionase family DNA binding protein
MEKPATWGEVLTLEEAAQFLRLPKETVRRYAAQGQVPGRRVGRYWRFLKAALEEWLRRPDGRTALLRSAGAFADDETMDELRASIYASRGRPESAQPHIVPAASLH